MTKTSHEIRESVCRVSTRGIHKWTRAIKHVISKAQFVHLLRCRYCAHYIGIEFNRVVLPSGRVTITERPFAIERANEGDEVTLKLRSDSPIVKAIEMVDNTTGFQGRRLSPSALLAEGATQATVKP